MKKNLLIMMSGGTTTVINSTLYGIIKESYNKKFFDNIYVAIGGIEGLLNNKIKNISKLSINFLEQIKKLPGSAVIGTSRINKLNQLQLNHIGKIADKFNINYIVNIGGNGTLEQTKKLNLYFNDKINFAFAPKTVDNDLGDENCKQLFFTPGFPSCVNLWKKYTYLLDIENKGAYSHDKVLVAQTFGRNTGYIAGATRLADIDHNLPLMILLPEDNKAKNKFYDYLDNLLVKYDRAIIITSEGYNFGNIGKHYDSRGQISYGSSKITVSQLIVNKLIKKMKINSRSFIPTIMQRQSFAESLNFDYYYAEKIGRQIVRNFKIDNKNFAMTILNPKFNNKKELVVPINFKYIKNFSRKMSNGFIKNNKFDVSNKYINYLNSFFKISKHEKNYIKFKPKSLINN